jgi:hypothetical protein
MAHPMATRLIAVVAIVLLAAPLFAGFAAERQTLLCTTHACPHHAAPPAAARPSCHHAAADAASCELKCGCQAPQAAQLAVAPVYLPTPPQHLALVAESSAAMAPAAAALRSGHGRLDPRPPRGSTSQS